MSQIGQSLAQDTTDDASQDAVKGDRDMVEHEDQPSRIFRHRLCAMRQVLAYEANIEAAVLAQEQDGGVVPLPEDYQHFIPKVGKNTVCDKRQVCIVCATCASAIFFTEVESRLGKR